MRAPTSSLKREFLKKWIMGLQTCSSSAKSMSITERKKVIKLSADVAMASARNGGTCWSRSLIATSSRDDSAKLFIDRILGSDRHDGKRITKNVNIRTQSSPSTRNVKRVRHKKILKKSSVRSSIRKVMKRFPKTAVASSVIAKRMVKKRTQILKSLVPGGEFMDDVSLIEETLDYILSLRAQIDVMRSLADHAADHQMMHAEL